MTNERTEVSPKPTTVEERVAELMEKAQEADGIYGLGLVLKETMAEARRLRRLQNFEDAEKYFSVKPHILISALEKSTSGQPGLEVRNIIRTRKDGVEVNRLHFIFRAHGQEEIKTDATFTQLNAVRPGIYIDFTNSSLA